MLEYENDKEIIDYAKALTHSPYLDDNYKGEGILRRENERNVWVCYRSFRK